MDLFLLGTICSFIIAVIFFCVRENVSQEVMVLAPIRWFGFGFAIFHVLVPFKLIIFGSDYADTAELTKMSFVGVITAVGYLLGWIFRDYRIIDHSSKTISEVSNKELYVLAGISFSLGIFGAVLILAYCGGVSAFFNFSVDLQDMVGTTLKNGIAFFIAQFIVVISILLYFITGNKHTFLIYLTLFVSIILFFLASMMLGSRSRMLFCIIPILVFLKLFNTKEKVYIWLLIAAFLLPSAMIFARTRSGITSINDQFVQLLKGNESKNMTFSDILNASEFDAFENGAQLISTVDRTGEFFYGRTFYCAIINPIPRFLWPDKPADDPADILRDNRVGKGANKKANIAISLAGECYANLGWLGAFSIPFVLGYVSSLIWRYLVHFHNNILYKLIMSLFAVFSLFVCRGSFLVMFTILLMAIFLPCIYIILIKYRYSFSKTIH